MNNHNNHHNHLSNVLKTLENNRPKHIKIVHNYVCVKCNKTEKEMKLVGAVPFCEACCKEVFKTNDPVYKERNEYLQWLKKYHEKVI